MHMISYAGKADMHIMVAKDLIPDPKVLAKCLGDTLLEMKNFAEVAASNGTNGNCIVKLLRLSELLS